MALPPSPPLTPSSSPNANSPIKSALKSTASTAAAPAGSGRMPAPPLTPQSSTDSLPLAETTATRHAPTFLDAVFPRGLGGSSPATVHTVGALPRTLRGVLVEGVGNGVRTLYVKGIQRVAVADLRDVVVELLDQADERLEADAVVFVLNKKKAGLRELLQGLLYVGGNVVRDADTSKDAVLVGIEL